MENGDKQTENKYGHKRFDAGVWGGKPFFSEQEKIPTESLIWSANIYYFDCIFIPGVLVTKIAHH